MSMEYVICKQICSDLPVVHPGFGSQLLLCRTAGKQGYCACFPLVSKCPIYLSPVQ